MAMISWSAAKPVYRVLSCVFPPHKGHRTRFMWNAERQTTKNMPSPRPAIFPGTFHAEPGHSQCSKMEITMTAMDSRMPRMMKRFFAET